MRKLKRAKNTLVAYVRVSTDEQANGGVSLAAQRGRITAYAKALGHRVVAVEQDSLSGKVAPARRPGLGRALAMVKSGEAAGLVVLKLDRLSRSIRHVLDLADAASREGWQLVSITEQLDTSSASGAFVLHVLSALAEMERRQIGERTSMGMAQVAREGRGRSRRLPFGFRLDGEPRATEMTAGDRRRLVKHAGEQRLLRDILALHDRGWGAYRIATGLNAKGAFNPRTGRPWNWGTLRGIVRTAERRRDEAGR